MKLKVQCSKKRRRSRDELDLIILDRVTFPREKRRKIQEEDENEIISSTFVSAEKFKDLRDRSSTL